MGCGTAAAVTGDVAKSVAVRDGAAISPADFTGRSPDIRGKEIF
jgi:hypothetical protein